MANTRYFTEEKTLYNILVILQCILIKVLPALGIIVMNIIIVWKVFQLVDTALPDPARQCSYSQLQTIWKRQQEARSSREPSVSLAHRHSPAFLELPHIKTGPGCYL